MYGKIAIENMYRSISPEKVRKMLYGKIFYDITFYGKNPQHIFDDLHLQIIESISLSSQNNNAG